MDAVAAAVEGLALAEGLRYSRWGYAAVNAAHIFGVALLIGGIVTLDLRLLGLWRVVELGTLYRVLSRVAASGLALAIASGLVLFSVRASEYVELELFFVKLSLVAAGLVLAAALHFGLEGERVTRARQRVAGLLSLAIWPSALVCGRLLAFV